MAFLRSIRPAILVLLTLFVVAIGVSAITADDDDDDNTFSSIESGFLVSSSRGEAKLKPAVTSGMTSPVQPDSGSESETTSKVPSPLSSASPQFDVPLRR
jgi:hypothetical protein